MKIVALIMIFAGLWVAFEIWRAPLMEETSDGKFKIKKPGKKIKDLFKSNSGTIDDLEKKGRGRSKH
jgi:hypothetical protein